MPHHDILYFILGTVRSDQPQEHTTAGAGLHIDADHEDQLGNADVMAVAESCHSVSDLLKQISVPQSRIREIERLTAGQSSNPMWMQVRRGRLTASIFYRVHTKVESLKKKPSTDCCKLIASLLNPPSLVHIPHIAAGSALESAAVNAFQAELCSIGHKNVKVDTCGIYISEDMPFLGASPDGVVSCSCCEEIRLLEVKCPTKEIQELIYLDDNKLLKKKTAYYGQVQGQLAITGLVHSYFYVFTQTGTSCDMIKRNDKFCKTLLNNLELFYTQYMGPAILKKAHDLKRRKLT